VGRDQDQLTVRTALAAPLVLVVDDDPEIRTLLSEILSADGIRCETAADGATAVQLAQSLRPQLVLLDLSLPGVSGDEVFARLRADHRTRFVPVMFLTGTRSRDTKITHLLAGGDDYVTKPFDVDELCARVQVTLRRARTLGGLNPLSGLPGNAAIYEEMTTLLEGGQTFACVYLDMDNFKAFNDQYGFTRGDMLIVALAEAIFAAVDGSAAPFLGHVGGDDFVVLCDPAAAEALAADVIARFRERSRALHDETDVIAGGYTGEDRRGVRTWWPMASVSAGIAVAHPGRFRSAADVAQTAAEMKNVATRQGGGRSATDRRHAAPA
jgi:DNA-binding response OmpR family regulator